MPVVLSSSITSQLPPRRASDTHSVRVRTCAPRKYASRAFSTTRRASCNPAVGVFERPAIAVLQRSPARVPSEIDTGAWRQQDTPPEVVVEQQAQSDHPPGPKPAVVRQHKAQRPDDVRGVSQQHLALAKGMAHEAEFALLQVSKPAMDQLGAGRRRVGGEVVLLAQQDAEPPSRGIARDARSVDAAPDDEQVDGIRGARVSHARRCSSFLYRMPIHDIRDPSRASGSNGAGRNRST